MMQIESLCNNKSKRGINIPFPFISLPGLLEEAVAVYEIENKITSVNLGRYWNFYLDSFQNNASVSILYVQSTYVCVQCYT